MSSIDEKIQDFNELILKEAVSERNKIIEQIRNEMETLKAQKSKKFREQADEVLRKETAAAEREKNNIISRAVIEGKQLLMRTRENIIKMVFDDTRKQLSEFVSGDEYLPYLIRTIKESCSQAGEGRLTVQISSADYQRFHPTLEGLRQELSGVIDFEAINDDIIGGCTVINRKENILIDNTISKKLELSGDGFFETCELRID